MRAEKSSGRKIQTENILIVTSLLSRWAVCI